jgi:hypothetical protein
MKQLQRRLAHLLGMHGRCDLWNCSKLIEDEYGFFPIKSRTFKCPGWDTPGRCQCGAPLPSMSKWANAGSPWSNILCSKCGTGYVDEDDFIAIYDPDRVEAMGGVEEWEVRTSAEGDGVARVPGEIPYCAGRQLTAHTPRPMVVDGDEWKCPICGLVEPFEVDVDG